MITGIIALPPKGHLKERYVTTGKDATFRFWQAKVTLSSWYTKPIAKLT